MDSKLKSVTKFREEASKIESSIQELEQIFETNEKAKEDSHKTILNSIDEFEGNTINLITNLCKDLRRVVQRSEIEVNNANEIKLLHTRLSFSYGRLLDVQSLLENCCQ